MFTLKLRAPGNPDHGQYAEVAPQLNPEIKNVGDAPLLVKRYISQYNLGGGNWGDGAGEIVDISGQVVARCAYNGKIIYPTGTRTHSDEWVQRTLNHLKQQWAVALGLQWKPGERSLQRVGDILSR